MGDKETFEKIESMYKSFSGCDMVASINILMPDGEVVSRVIGSLQTFTYSIHMEKHPIRSIGNINAKDYVFGPRTIAGTLVFTVFNKHFTKEIFEEIKDKNPGRYEKYNFVADELPPFDITISFANEYGAVSRLAVYGIRIINEGKTLSMNDIYTENTYQYYATDIEYMEDDRIDTGYVPPEETTREVVIPEPPEEDIDSDDTEDPIRVIANDIDIRSAKQHMDHSFYTFLTIEEKQNSSEPPPNKDDIVLGGPKAIYPELFNNNEDPFLRIHGETRVETESRLIELIESGTIKGQVRERVHSSLEEDADSPGNIGYNLTDDIIRMRTPYPEGSHISDIQHVLRKLGYSPGENGIYGPRTSSAVESFQENAGITVDGIWGPETRGEVIRRL